MRPMLFKARQVEWSERPRCLLAVGANVVRRRNQARAKEIAVGSERTLFGEFGGIGANRRDRGRMCILDVDIERASAGIFEAADRLVVRPDAVDLQTLYAAGVLFEVGITEDSDRPRIGLD